ncbi:hypothetical protein [Nonomuraea sp. NPDC050540]
MIIIVIVAVAILPAPQMTALGTLLTAGCALLTLLPKRASPDDR